jgi:hypothetical protein
VPATLACAVAVPLVLARTRLGPDVTAQPLTTAARLWRSGNATVVVLDQPPSPGLAAALRRARIRRVDVLAVTSVDSRMGHALDDLIPAVHPAIILSPPGFHRPNVVVAGPGTTVAAGRFVVSASADDPVRFSVAPR